MKTPMLLVAVALVINGCATTPKPPPEITLDTPAQVKPAVEAAKPIDVVAVPQPVPLPGQLKPIAAEPVTQARAPDPRERIGAANDDARVAPTPEGYLNSIQVWPYAEGALYQLYASPGRVSDIALQPGEELITVAAGDTVRWIVGDTTSGAADQQRVHILIKPVRANLKTNLVITTNRRLYLLELSATQDTWMASVSWDYPNDRLLALKREAKRAEASAPAAQGITLERLSFRYDITGDTPPWRPVRAFDDGERVYIQFPAGITQGDLPPVFVVSSTGEAELVNYRYRAPYYIVDRLFGAAELHLGGDHAQIVRISRTDSVKHS